MIRVYCVDPHATLTVNFTDKKMGESRFIWTSLGGISGEWIDVIITGDTFKNVIDGFENITHMNIRFLRNAGAAVAGQEEYISYVDKISLYGLDYNRVKYTFADDYDMRVVSGMNNGSGVRTVDPVAKDGYALKGTSVYNANESGVEISFDNLKLSSYAHIYMRIRSTEGVSVNMNGISMCYANYPEYTEVDLLPMLLEKGQTTLKTLAIGRKTFAGVQFYIDGITFVTTEEARIDYSKVKYTFMDEYDMKVASGLKGCKVEQVRDSAAADGYAVKGTTAYNADPSGLQLTFDNL